MGGIVLNLITVNREKIHKRAFIQTIERGRERVLYFKTEWGIVGCKPKMSKALSGEKSHLTTLHLWAAVILKAK